MWPIKKHKEAPSRRRWLYKVYKGSAFYGVFYCSTDAQSVARKYGAMVKHTEYIFVDNEWCEISKTHSIKNEHIGFDLEDRQKLLAADAWDKLTPDERGAIGLRKPY